MVRLSPGTEPDGAIVVDKPQGLTSHDVVAKARKLLGTRSVGHAGTLDPMATGVLVLLVGEARKLSAYVTKDEKRYVARVAFGRSTDTDDAEGAVREERELATGWLDGQRLAEAARREADRSLQIPPAFSAIQVAGERAHRLSRRGTPPSLPARPVRVLELRTLGFDDHSASFELVVSKGYYVRAFARDLGSALDVPAHLAELRRLASGRFSLDDANPWPLPETPSVLPLAETAARALEVVDLTAEGARRARLGQTLMAEHLAGVPPTANLGEVCAFFAPDGALVALCQRKELGELRVVRGFVSKPRPG